MDLNKLFDYTDNFTEIVRTTRPISAEELTVRFFCAPQWIIALMKFRNAIVKPFGLKGEKNLSDLVIVESDSLATISKSDKHIDFEPVHMSGKRFKKCAGFLPNAHQKKFGKKSHDIFTVFQFFHIGTRFYRGSDIANHIECVAMFDFIASVPRSFLNNTKAPNFTFLGVKLGVCFAIC